MLFVRIVSGEQKSHKVLHVRRIARCICVQVLSHNHARIRAWRACGSGTRANRAAILLLCAGGVLLDDLLVIERIAFAVRSARAERRRPDDQAKCAD